MGYPLLTKFFQYRKIRIQATNNLLKISESLMTQIKNYMLYVVSD